MGVDCKIFLPAACRIDDVADVLLALAGHPCHRVEHANTWWAQGARDGMLQVFNDMPECVRILIPNCNDGCSMHEATYHFEGGRRGERLLMPRSTAWWLAIGKGLVDFFGGSIDYDDSDTSDVDYGQPERTDIHAEDGDEWVRFQERKLAVEPITQHHVDAIAPFAAYPQTTRIRDVAELVTPVKAGPQ